MITYTFPMSTGGEQIRNEHTLLAQLEGGRMMTSAQAVRFLVLHCSATRRDRAYTVEQMARDHKGRGFQGIGYHFYVRRDGTLTQHRMLLEVGAHARPYNRCSIGICYEGGLDEHGHPADTRTAAQTSRLDLLLYELHRLFPQARIVGHRDLPGTTPKDCPCLDTQAEFGWIEDL